MLRVYKNRLRSPSPTPAASALSIGQDAIVSADKLAGAVPEGHQLVHKDLKDQYSEALATTEKQSKAESKGASGSHEDPETRAARLIKGDFGCPQLMWVVDVSCRLTNEACSLFPMLFASQTDFEESTGVLRLNSRGAKMYQESGSVLFENAALNKNDYGEERYALISPQAMCPGLNKSDYAGVFHAAKMSNLSFDLLTNTGLIFNSLDVFESLVSLTTVARTPQACVSQLAHGLQVVSDIEKATHGAAGKSMGANLDTHDGYDDLYVRDQQVSLRQMGRKLDKNVSNVAKHVRYEQNDDHVQIVQSISRFAMMREQAEREREEYLAMVSSRERAAQRGTAQSGPI